MFNILVVDDDKNTRLLMRAVLEAEKYTVSTAEDGKKALEIMVNNDINIDDIEVEDGITYIYGDPKDLFTIKGVCLLIIFLPRTVTRECSLSLT